MRGYVSCSSMMPTISVAMYTRLLCSFAVFLPESEKAIDLADCICGLDRHGFEKVPYPFLPSTFPAHREQVTIIVVTMALEVRAEVEKRLREQFFGAQEKGDKQPAHAAIAIQEGMNGLELVVDEGKTDERGHLRRRMKVFFKPIQGIQHLLNGRRHKGCLR
jgi:hypothetical protein